MDLLSVCSKNGVPGLAIGATLLRSQRRWNDMDANEFVTATIRGRRGL